MVPSNESPVLRQPNNAPYVNMYRMVLSERDCIGARPNVISVGYGNKQVVGDTCMKHGASMSDPTNPAALTLVFSSCSSDSVVQRAL